MGEAHLEKKLTTGDENLQLGWRNINNCGVKVTNCEKNISNSGCKTIDSLGGGGLSCRIDGRGGS